MTPVVTVTMNPAVDLSAVADRVEPERKLRCRDVRRDPGGGGVNVARVLHRLGVPARALYPAGGSPGETLHRLLDAEGIDSLPVLIAGETRENVTVLSVETEEQFRFVLPGPALAPPEWQACLDRLAALPPPGIVVASGGLPPGVPAAVEARIVRAAARLGARAVVDSSGPALAAALEERVFLVKPNLRELVDLVGRPLEHEAEWTAAAAGLVEAGQAEVVALTLGHRGALLVTRERRLYAPPVPVKLESAVGAGDSFLGAMVWRLAAGAPLDDAFRHGVAAGTAALMTPGTGLCRPDDLARILPEVALVDLGRG